MTNLYIDTEWYLSQRIFLIGFAIENTITGKVIIEQMWRRNIYRRDIFKMFDLCSGYVFVYGPDIGMLEKRYRYPFREKYKCLNFLRLVKHLEPGLPSYALNHVEKHFGIYRQSVKYKKNVFSIYDDWRNPALKKQVLSYNNEDVKFMIQLKQIIFQKHSPTLDWLDSMTLR